MLQEYAKHQNLMKPTSLETILSELSNKYVKLILMGDFNVSLSNWNLSQLLGFFAISSLNINPFYFRNSQNPTCSDLLLTNFKFSLMKTNAFETGISDHHKMTSTITKLHFTSESPKTKYYRDYSKLDIDYFNSEFGFIEFF